MTPKLLIGTAAFTAIVVLGIGVYQYNTAAPLPGSSAPATQTTGTGTALSSTSTSSAVQTYTMADVQQHNNATSCWSAINGNVYDLTNWINQHPGGPEHILAICGTDGSASFNAQHAGNAQVAATLQQFYIGTLAQ